MHRTLLLASLSLSLASVASAQTHFASFDGLAEQVLGNTYSEDGLLFDDIDSYLGSGTVLPFIIENASGSFGAFPGFSSPNVLAFNSPDPGPGVFGLGRWGSFTITPPGVRQSAAVSIIMLGTFFGSNQVNLEATLNGNVVASDSMAVLNTGGFHSRVLSISGVDFDQLRVFSSGTADQGASFASFDSVLVEGGPPGTSYCTSTANSTGSAALISTSGTRSVNANDLVLHASPVPNQFGIFYYGPAQTQTPFGNGNRCVDGMMMRLDPTVASNNELTDPLNVNNPAAGVPAIAPGETWNFQGWFRDPDAGGSNFNLTDGREVTFTP